MEILLEAENLRRAYTIGKTTLEVLKGISLEVNAGETL